MVENFVIGFAEYESEEIRAMAINPGIKDEMLKRIDYALRLRESGKIAALDAVKIIGHFQYSTEDMSRYMI